MNFVIAGVLFCGVLIILVLWTFGARNLSNNKMLALSLACVWYILLMNQFNITGFILQIPHFSRTAILAGFLALPLLYVYTRNTFYPGKICKRKDWWFLIPPAFYIIDLAPYFVLSAESKAKLMEPVFKDASMRMAVNEGWLAPNWVHYSVLYSVAFYLWIGIIRIIIRNQHMEGEKISVTNKPLYLMLVMLSIAFSIMIVPGLIGAIFRVEWFNMNFIAFSLALPFLGVAIFLAFSPRVLYGFITPQYIIDPNKFQDIPITTYSVPEDKISTAKKITTPQSTEEKENQSGLSDRQLDSIYEKLNAYMEENRPFLKQSLSIHDLSEELRLPVYALSKVINQKTGANFNKWINSFRVKYFLMLYQNQEYQQLTLEALAQKAGFLSRVTFIKNFKSEMNDTPTQYIKTHFKKDFS